MFRNYLRRARFNNRGSAIVPALVVVMVAAGMGVAMLQMTAGSSNRQRQSLDKKRAFYVAEAGLAEAFMSVSKGMSGNIGTPDVPASFGDGVYWVEATELADGNLALVSTGLVGSGRFCAAITIEKQLNPFGLLGVFGDKSLTVGGSCIIDGYDSSIGSFEIQAKETPLGLTTATGASVSANANIHVSGPALPTVGTLPAILGPATTIFGDVHPGPEGLVLALPGSNITGSTHPNAKRLQMPPVNAPASTPTASFSTSSPNQEIPACQVAYINLTVNSATTLHLKGPLVLTVDVLRVKRGGKLNFDTTNGPITVYTQKGLITESGSELSNVTKDPRRVAVFVTNKNPVDYTGDRIPDPPVSLQGGGTFYGVLSARFVDIAIPATLRLFGGASAANLTLAERCRVTFDKALIKSSVGAHGAPGMLSWKIVELPDVPLVKSGRDPILQLRELSINPRKSDRASADQQLTMQYMSAAGAVRTFTGDPDTVNWADVRTIISKTWTTIP